MNKYAIPVVAGGMLLFAVYHVSKAQQVAPKGAPPVEPARSPFSRSVAGSGIVEAETENISIGTHLPGVVADVAAKVGQRVSAGTILFRVDDRNLKAEERLRAANLASAEAQLAKLAAMPRPEELPPAEAKVREARANLDNWSDQYERAQKLYQQRAIGEEEVVKIRQSRQAAQEQWDRAKAELALLQAGAWDADKAVARASVVQMQAQLEMTRTELDRLAVRAPVSGEVLQVNVRPGEFVGATAGQPLVVLGNIDRLHVRVDIDENDIHRFSPEAAAEARLRGDPKKRFGLKFVRIEPFVIPKKSLTGGNTERVDTRVLQVIYALESESRVYVGQQLDVFFESRD